MPTLLMSSRSVETVKEKRLGFGESLSDSAVCRLLVVFAFGFVCLFSTVCGVQAATETKADVEVPLSAVPDGSWVVMTWAGLDHVEGFEDSKLNGLLSEPAIEALLSESMTMIMDLMSFESLEAMEEAEGQFSMFKQAIMGQPWVMYVYLEDGVSLTESEPLFSWVVEFDTEAEAKAMHAMLNVMEAEKAIDPEIKQPWDEDWLFFENETFLIDGRRVGVMSQSETQLVVSQPIDIQSAFGKSLEAMPIQDDSRLFSLMVDTAAIVPAVIDRFDRSDDSITNASVLDEIGEILRSLQLDTFEQAIYTIGFVDGSWVTQTRLVGDPSGGGLWHMFDGEPINTQLLELIPNQAEWFSATTADITSLWRDIQKSFEASEEVYGSFNNSLSMVEAFTQVDLQEDVITALGPDWVFYDDNNAASILAPGISIMNRLTSPEAAEKLDIALAKIITGYSEKLDEALDFGDEMPFMPASTQTFGDVNVHTIGTPPAGSFAFAVHNQILHFSTSPRAVLAASRRAARATPLMEDEGFLDALSQLGLSAIYEKHQGQLSKLVYADLPETAPLMYHTMTSAVQLMNMVLEEPLAFEFPTYAELEPHLEPIVQLAYVDELGWVQIGRKPFPLANIFSPEISTSTTVVGFGALAVTPPILAASRRNLRQTQNNMQAIGLHHACTTFAFENQSGFPDEFYPLLKGEYFTIDYLVSPTYDVEIPDKETFESWTSLKQRNWVRTNASFVLIPGLEDNWNSETVAVFQKPSHADDDLISVVFNDSTFRVEPVEVVDQLLREQTGKSLEQHVAESEQPVTE